ncbi:MAG: ABC transporter ATP-binding protein [Thaumarchaeota archaeon]|nr:ABC transporter ATP-binding protein [Nitrososphaerota archaeon]
MTTLAVKDLTVSYRMRERPVTAVDGVSFYLDNKKSLGIVGESGCGKSTLGLAILRSVFGGRIDSGEILLDGKPLMEMQESEFSREFRWKKIAMVFQGAMNALDPVFSIRQQFEEVLNVHDGGSDSQITIKNTIASVGLEEGVLDMFPHELSGGMKQRVVIAMALLLRPVLVIADEPTTALDVLVQAQILELLKSLKTGGMSLVLISHDLGIIAEVSDMVGIMYAGRMVEFGAVTEIYSRPMHPYTQALLRLTPKIRGESNLVTLEGYPPSPSNLPKGCRFYDRCSQAMEKCRSDPPIIKTKTGYVECWLYEIEK